MDFDFEISKIIEEIKKRNAKIVVLEFPEGLKKYSIKVAEEIENKTNAKTIIFIDPIYGACDNKFMEIKNLEEKINSKILVIHFGHEEWKI
ncbi:MAG: diphthamide synthesis protein [Candidatus Altarchaeaceae archaeon]